MMSRTVEGAGFTHLALWGGAALAWGGGFGACQSDYAIVAALSPDAGDDSPRGGAGPAARTEIDPLGPAARPVVPESPGPVDLDPDPDSEPGRASGQPSPGLGPSEAEDAGASECPDENGNGQCDTLVVCDATFQEGATLADRTRADCRTCGPGDTEDIDSDGVPDACDQCGAASVLRYQPIFYFAFDDEPGATSTRNLGSANPEAVLLGGASSGVSGVADTLTGALRVPGQGNQQFPRLQVDQVFDWPSQAISVSLWVRTRQQTDFSLISYAVEGSSNEFGLIVEGNTIRLALEGVTFDVATFASRLADGAWHFLGVSWQGAAARFYIDGEPAGQPVVTAVNPNAPTPPFGSDPGEALDLESGGILVLGQDQDGLGSNFQTTQALEGALDEVAVYPVALQEADFRELYTATTCGEICNGIDDDRDGLVDEGFAGSRPQCPAASCAAIAEVGADFGSGGYFLRADPNALQACSF